MLLTEIFAKDLYLLAIYFIYFREYVFCTQCKVLIKTVQGQLGFLNVQYFIFIVTRQLNKDKTEVKFPLYRKAIL